MKPEPGFHVPAVAVRVPPTTAWPLSDGGVTLVIGTGVSWALMPEAVPLTPTVTLVPSAGVAASIQYSVKWSVCSKPTR